jgi:C1A family cysteine protease
MHQHAYGWRPSPPDPRNYITEIPEATPPKEYDPRGETLPILDQAELGACTANATMRAIRYAFLIAGADPGDLSRLWAYAQTRFMEGGWKQFAEDSGAFGRDDFKVARKLGLLLEDVWPYDDYKSTFDDEELFKGLKKTIPVGARYFIDTYSHPSPTPAAFEAVLSSKKMVPFGFPVYESFESAAVAKTGIVPVPGPREQLLGGHEIAAEGYVYISGKRYWLCPNNWSEDWGDKGYCYFPDELLFGHGASDWRVVDAVRS